MTNFERFVESTVTRKALCEAILAGYRAYLESEQSQQGVPANMILDGLDIPNAGNIDRNGVFTAKESMFIGKALGDSIANAWGDTDDPRDTNAWKMATVINGRLVKTNKQMLVDAFKRGINSRLKAFTGSGETFK